MMVLRRIFEMVPILTVPVVIYAFFAAITAATRGPDIFTQAMERGAFVLTMPSGAPWAVSGGDLLLMLGLFILFFELTRGVGVSRYAIIHHTLAVLLALCCAGAFLVFEAFATSTFFLLTLMCWLDMIGGVIFNIANAPSGGRGGGGGDAYGD
ncbi:hypothetical protein [Candidatus Phycosocius bacilliformis]|nr:hypothetical protein [Candidatus Phycosocius bacilliformis]